MKRLAAVFALICLILCGCGDKKISPRLMGISFDAAVECGSSQYSGSAEIDGLGVMYFEITAPSELCGMKLILTPHTTKAEFCELSYEWGDMVQGGAIKAFYDTFTAVEGGAAPNEKNCVISTGDYSLTYSPVGLPINLKIPKEDITVLFSNVSIKEE